VLSDILDVSKIEAGEFQLTPAPFDLAPWCGGVAELHAAVGRGQASGLPVVDPARPPGLLGDAGRISQILNNLLANAVKFTAEGEVALSVERADDKA
jgi:signal transduction histidine kinase